jgi:hypothetical protein
VDRLTLLTWKGLASGNLWVLRETVQAEILSYLSL